LNINIPYPFVTTGAVPIQTHDSVSFTNGCFVPSPNLNSAYTISCNGGSLSPSGNPVILLSNYSSTNIGVSQTQCRVSGPIPPTGYLYVTVHLDYGLESRTPAWQQSATLNSALSSSTCGVSDNASTITDPQTYAFSYSNGSNGLTNPKSINQFKKNPGVNGLTLQTATGNPKSGVKVELWSPANKLLLSYTTDVDGFYMLNYKHTGKAADYAVKLPAFGLTKKVTLKANGYAIVLFEELP
jgi:hypothetical protein